ncbi:hypothetical protein SERLADRAFT_479348 [Serpula lacrymans var. lacrymans S7.9]|uniref:Uncharacterized protein n=1 Tax=Serpula lacrymans var. lacrymans (strain S7.9) TaxID=578457 RepID=F8PBN1_SERL9|nr:uncharacterized protein SERLADRAFT_479348 [Serpula lacrymans var. lacrymans S7.9]EGO19669.1 hypothetical protein SERLADRAFT_479348 [Serpula lacrymans var. lacrymans S7.9]
MTSSDFLTQLPPPNRTLYTLQLCQSVVQNGVSSCAFTCGHSVMGHLTLYPAQRKVVVHQISPLDISHCRSSY